MNSIQVAREVLGWCTAINIGLLAFAAIAVLVLGGPIRRFHASLFKLSEDDLSRAYFQYLAQYKIALVIFNLAPYVALCLVEVDFYRSDDGTREVLAPRILDTAAKTTRTGTDRANDSHRISTRSLINRELATPTTMTR